MNQKEAFLAGEGDAWFNRNHDQSMWREDQVINAIKQIGLVPHRVLEIGCASNGWRLNRLIEEHHCEVVGVDPATPLHPHWIYKGTADDLGPLGTFSLVIYGFCLYLCDREDLFKIAAEGDRVLEDKGYLIIHDFYPDSPHRRIYKYYNGLFSYKQDYSRLWLGNPAYTLEKKIIFQHEGDQEAVIVLRKNIKKGWPIRDF